MDDNSTNGLLVAALQKFYSALHQLEMFGQTNDLLDSISHIDGFLSEYRNVTFVLQKSIAHTKFKSKYETLREKYLSNSDSKWLVEKRNETIKEHPFALEKYIKITIYDHHFARVLENLKCTFNDDKSIDDVVTSIKEKLRGLRMQEMYFSVGYFYCEKGIEEKELLSILILAAKNMKHLLAELRSEIPDDSTLFHILEDKIEKAYLNVKALQFSLVKDYVYYPTIDKLEGGTCLESLNFDRHVRLPIIDYLKRTSAFDIKEGVQTSTWDCFVKFTLIHFFYEMQNKHIMPTFMLVYDDDTLSIHPFLFSIKTTMYRHINEIAELIRAKKEIKAVFLVEECYVYRDMKAFNYLPDERYNKYHPTEFLLFVYMTSNEIKNVMVDTNKIKDTNYLKNCILQSQSGTEIYSVAPIVEAFKKTHKI